MIVPVTLKYPNERVDSSLYSGRRWLTIGLNTNTHTEPELYIHDDRLLDSLKNTGIVRNEVGRDIPLALSDVSHNDSDGAHHVFFSQIGPYPSHISGVGEDKLIIGLGSFPFRPEGYADQVLRSRLSQTSFYRITRN